ncbi:hypothetical protein [Streptomyces sp. NBC_01483]|uniref:hypothetical protein n=1 Tax=Streptomyces sp. NBC_01483 TaxID=2903883 RepID=UPI002E30E257|nr:hypothetical protein [Streptomyces sp. NBC_01483]
MTPSVPTPSATTPSAAGPADLLITGCTALVHDELGAGGEIARARRPGPRQTDSGVRHLIHSA